jgi:bifunctional UDP-N-acetylglucosamine pyrophosphorylase / glucosamine-1-phosphate N-acetyltransferase
MRSRVPKVLHPICGRPMLAYVIDGAREATGDRPLVVYSPATAQVCEAFANEADFALQDEPRGTGDAVRAALEALPDDVEEIVVLSGDSPLTPAEYVVSVLERMRQASAVMSLAVGAGGSNSDYGRVAMDGQARVERIVEVKDAGPEELEISTLNMGLYGFDVAWLRQALPRLRPSAATGELYLTQLVELARGDGRAVTSWVAGNGALLDGINDRAQLALVEATMRRAIVERHQLAGVTIEDTATNWIEATVEIAQDVTIEHNVILRGRTKIGRDTVIRAGSQIIDSTIGERCTVWASIIEESALGNDVKVGPFSHLRGGCQVADGAEIGNYAEQKNTRFGARSKQHHFSYLGDAEIGEDVNIGAGTITANFDGRAKHRTVIGDRAFIGSDTILRAPVQVGADAATGAGSVVTRDVPAGMLALGVPARVRDKRSAESGVEEQQS